MEHEYEYCLVNFLNLDDGKERLNNLARERWVPYLMTERNEFIVILLRRSHLVEPKQS